MRPARSPPDARSGEGPDTGSAGGSGGGLEGGGLENRDLRSVDLKSMASGGNGPWSGSPDSGAPEHGGPKRGLPSGRSRPASRPPASHPAGRRLIGSLRGKLVLSMSATAVLSLGLVTALHAIASGRDGLIGRVSRIALGDELPEPWQDLAVLLPFSVVVVILVAAVTVWNLRPLTRASEEAARVGPARPEARIGADGLPSEVAPLVRAFNGALDRLGHAYEAERRFTADAAHELRTPLAALRLRLQRARSGAPPDWPAVERDLAQMSRLVSQLLELARKEATLAPAAAGPDTAPAPLNLARIGREAAASVLPLVEEAGRRLEVDLADDLPVRGRADDLRDLVRNLLENALQHGSGVISLSGRRGRDTVALEIADQGEGVAPALRPLMFDRFRKGAQGSAGSGLGLAIVRAVARSHGATVAFVDGPECRVRVVMPALADGRLAA